MGCPFPVIDHQPTDPSGEGPSTAEPSPPFADFCPPFTAESCSTHTLIVLHASPHSAAFSSLSIDVSVSSLPKAPTTECSYYVLSHVRVFAVPWTIACQAPGPMESSRQEHRGGLPFPTPGDLPDLGIEPVSLASPAVILSKGRKWIYFFNCLAYTLQQLKRSFSMSWEIFIFSRVF